MGLAAAKKKRKVGLDPNNTRWARNTDSFGHKLLRQQGWEPGQYLGAKDAPHAEWHTAASASHIRVILKEDNLGLGAKRNHGDQCTGLDDFQNLLGRLNGKTEAVLETEQQARADIKLNLYMEQKFGTMRFVKGGWLVGDEVQEEPKISEEESEGKDAGAASDAQPATLAEAEDTPVSPKKRKLDDDTSSEEKKSKKRKPTDEPHQETEKERRRRERKERKARKADEGGQAAADKEKKGKKKKDKKKDTRKRRKEQEDAEETVPGLGTGIGSSEPATDLDTRKTGKSKRSKSKRKASGDESSETEKKRASKKKRRKAEEESGERTSSPGLSSIGELPGTLSRDAGGSSTPVNNSHPTLNRDFLRQRFIAKQKKVFSDPQALNQIFMIKSQS